MHRPTQVLLVIIISLLLAACGRSDYLDNRGNSGRFVDLRGKWLVINYWAVWCKPCIEEIPELNRFAAEHHDTVIVFGVDFDQSSGDKLQQGIDKLGIGFPVLITDPSLPLGFTRPAVLPTTLVFNPEGKLHKTLLGPQTQSTLQRALQSD